MKQKSIGPSRRWLLAGALGAAAAVVAGVAAACTPRQPAPTEPAPSSESPAAPPASPTPTPSPVTVTGLPADLAAVATALYTGGPVITTGATSALQQRGRPSGAVTVTGSQGDWHGTAVACLAQGQDLTLLVKAGQGWQVVAGWWPDLGVAGPLGGGRQFVLVMGSDAREPGEKVTATRADALQIAGVDGQGAGGVLGIPRDSWVGLATGGSGKINSAMAYGGPDAQVRTVAGLTGLPIQHYVLTGFNGFRGFVSTLGGVTVDSPYAMPSRGIAKGTQQLDQHKALWFARERESLPRGDFDRSANQQRLLAAFAAALKAKGPTQFGPLATALSNATVTNLPAEQALQFAAWALRLDLATVGWAVATGGFATRGGQSVVVLGGEATALFRGFADGNLP